MNTCDQCCYFDPNPVMDRIRDCEFRRTFPRMAGTCMLHAGGMIPDSCPKFCLFEGADSRSIYDESDALKPLRL